jgi:hypothetical protein
MISSGFVGYSNADEALIRVPIGSSDRLKAYAKPE